MAEYSEEQVGKRVVSQEGEEIGEVTAIDDGSMVVRVTVGNNNDVVDHMGWDTRTNQETHTLNDRYVSNIRENAVRLRV
ncbi:hypothetical protein ACFQMA_15135 [Halosimplex aquaticum]|uniref:DUF2171 domain-containing protein n=1 Tax=Halosimplex aquaticum TaxID=3026162 RepID=A0ABD5Y1M3_9EURY|nr:hypothetical protein [Halosimplex aquaticum]